MTINMQGSWTVSVKSFESFEPPQRYVVAGAASGNGNHASNSGPVFVTGDHWTITNQMEQGGHYVNSPDEIGFPTVSGGQYHFDIRSNVHANDPVWDDMVLT